jgi:hypothetical protein
MGGSLESGTLGAFHQWMDDTTQGRFLIQWKNLEHLELSSTGWMDGWMDGLINGIIRIGFLIQWKNLEHLELSTGGWMTG